MLSFLLLLFEMSHILRFQMIEGQEKFSPFPMGGGSGGRQVTLGCQNPK